MLWEPMDMFEIDSLGISVVGKLEGATPKTHPEMAIVGYHWGKPYFQTDLGTGSTKANQRKTCRVSKIMLQWVSRG